jgi:hypothetical protein
MNPGSGASQSLLDRLERQPRQGAGLYAMKCRIIDFNFG